MLSNIYVLGISHIITSKIWRLFYGTISHRCCNIFATKSAINTKVLICVNRGFNSYGPILTIFWISHCKSIIRAKFYTKFFIYI